jgi:hypothetical protein
MKGLRPRIEGLGRFWHLVLAPARTGAVARVSSFRSVRGAMRVTIVHFKV